MIATCFGGRGQEMVGYDFLKEKNAENRPAPIMPA